MDQCFIKHFNVVIVFPLKISAPQCLHFALTTPDDSQGISKFLSSEADMPGVSFVQFTLREFFFHSIPLIITLLLSLQNN